MNELTEKAEEIRDYLENISFKYKDISRVHDWRNYISHDLVNIWHELTLFEKYLIYHCLEKQASEEVWD